MRTNDSNEWLASQGEDEIIEPPQVVVKFHDRIELTYADDIGDELDQKFDKMWSRLKERFQTISIKRLFTSVEPDRIKDLVEKAKQKAQQKDRDYAPPNFLTYFIVEYVDGKDPAALASAFLDLEDIVEDAYVKPKPAPSPNADPILFHQNFLNPNDEGVHAAYGWSFPGGKGDNIRLIDMEKGWDSHTDIPLDINNALINESDNSFEREHGTKVLGVILAQDSGTHCKCGSGTDCACSGIAKNAITNLVSEWRTTPELRNNKADAILAAINFLDLAQDSDGSVLLIESQSDLALNDPDPSAPPNFYPSTGYAPIEVYTAEFDAIELATNSNIVVIEAAGNSVSNAPNSYDDPVDLDSVEKRFGTSPGAKILNRTDPGFKDSGAIIVGAGTWMVEHQRTQRPALASSETTPAGDAISGIPTNYGSRVDCYAWGEYVTTTHTGNTYMTSFGGTSSASAIIAGVALVVQGIAKAHNLGDNPNGTYNPDTLRTILSTDGTSSNNPATDLIGVMPDLKKIIDNIMGFGT